CAPPHSLFSPVPARARHLPSCPTRRSSDLPAFRQAVNAWAAEHAPRPKPAALPLDAAVTLEELTLEQVQQLQQLAPFGRENPTRSEEHTSELQSRFDLVCRLLLEKKNRKRC